MPDSRLGMSGFFIDSTHSIKPESQSQSAELVSLEWKDSHLFIQPRDVPMALVPVKVFVKLLQFSKRDSQLAAAEMLMMIRSSAPVMLTSNLL